MFTDFKYLKEICQKSNPSILERKILARQININEGTKYLENEYIKIEYHNKIGLEKAKMLISIFEQNKEFYKHFLKKFDKIVIQNGALSSEKIIAIDNLPTDILEENFLKKILPTSPMTDILTGHILNKLQHKDSLSKQEIIDFLKKDILNNSNIKNVIQIYLENNLSLVTKYEVMYKVIINLAFSSNMSLLEKYLDCKNVKIIEKETIDMLKKEYNIDILNDLFDHQEEKIKEQKNDFLTNNFDLLVNFIFEKSGRFYEEYNKMNSKTHEKQIMKKNDIVALVIEFLDQIDQTNTLSKIFTTNLENKIIKLWDPANEFEAKEIYDIYHDMSNSNKKIEEKSIYEPQVAINYSKNKIIMNVPLTYTIEDVRIIIHEFFHLYSQIKNLSPPKNKILDEFLSIYYEMKTYDFLLEKGYNKEQLSILKLRRIKDNYDKFNNYSMYLCILKKYHQNVSWEEIFDFISFMIKRKYESKLTDSYLDKQKIDEYIQEETNTMIEQLCVTSLASNEEIFEILPYFLGTLLSYEAIDNGIDNNYMLDLAGVINDIEDPCEVLENMGINLEEYGFIKTVNQNSNKMSH